MKEKIGYKDLTLTLKLAVIGGFVAFSLYSISIGYAFVVGIIDALMGVL